MRIVWVAVLIAASAAASVLPVNSSLTTYYSVQREDNLAIASDDNATQQWALAHNYTAYPGENGAVFLTAPADATAWQVVFYYNPTMEHSLVTASPQGHAFAAANGYVEQTPIGFFLAEAPQGLDGLLPMATWYSVQRRDHILVCNLTSICHSLQDALHAGYTYAWDEGFAPLPATPWQVWPDASGQFPDLPFERSSLFNSFSFNTLDNVIPPSIAADTWYPSWAADGSLYSTFTDGTVLGVRARSAGSPNSPMVSSGACRVVGDSPSNLTVEWARLTNSSSLPYQGRWVGSAAALPPHCRLSRAVALYVRYGRYPSANLWYKGVWYYGTYSLGEMNGNAQYPCGNWCRSGGGERARVGRAERPAARLAASCGWCPLLPGVQGPFVGFRFSTDLGITWVEPREQMASSFQDYNRTRNLFQELGPVCPAGVDPSTRSCQGRWTGKVKFGAPHVVDLGQELAYSPDGVKRAYVVGHGASKEYQPQSWMHGSEVYLARTTAEVSPEVMLSSAFWEFFSGHGPNGEALWSPSVDDATPLFAWENKTGVVTMTWVPAVQRFIMAVGTPTNPLGNGSMTGMPRASAGSPVLAGVDPAPCCPVALSQARLMCIFWRAPA